jgi:hypothetical protein
MGGRMMDTFKIIRSFKVYMLRMNQFGVKLEKDVMGGSCSTLA